MRPLIKGLRITGNSRIVQAQELLPPSLSALQLNGDIEPLERFAVEKVLLRSCHTTIPATGRVHASSGEFCKMVPETQLVAPFGRMRFNYSMCNSSVLSDGFSQAPLDQDFFIPAR
jgi:hypothetical protein